MELEREEEMLTNTLQKRLQSVQKEKTDVETELTLLKHQLENMQVEREALAKQLEHSAASRQALVEAVAEKSNTNRLES